MKLGADPKKLAILAVLLLVAAYFVYTNACSNRSVRPVPAPAAPTAAGVRPEAVPELGRPAPRAEVRSPAQPALQEFRPSLKPRKAGERGELSSIDATLQLGLLARLQDVRMRGGDRSLFEFSAPPLPKTPEPKVIPKPLAQIAQPAPPAPSELDSKPVAPPIPLKFYGYSRTFPQGKRRAFFLDGDDILIASEGEVLKKRYRVVSIGETSVVMEDIQFKAEQKLQMVPPQVG
jgi:hypothetical protein